MSGKAKETAPEGKAGASAPARPASHGPGNDQGRRIVVARRATLSAVFAAVIVSLAFDSGLGTPSSFGVGEFFLLCPLGGIEAFAASKAFIPVSAISAGIVLLIALVFGRAWCAWGCPAPVIRRFFKREPEPVREGLGDALSRSDSPRSLRSLRNSLCEGTPQPLATDIPLENDETGAGAEGGSRGPDGGFLGALKHIAHDARTWTFAAVAVAAFVAGFPIFCLMCPIGLTFGTVGSLWHLVVDKQMTLSVIVFPLALVIELVIYRKWCLNLCPIAGLLGIVGQFARLFRPRINAQTCLRYHDGANCSVCTAACPEHIDIHAPDAAIALGECTRCGECAAQCPTASIAFKLAASEPVLSDAEGR